LGKKILIIEGFGKNLDILRDAIIKAEQVALVAPSADDAEKMMEQASLTILDLANPDTSGLNLSSMGFTNPEEYIEKTITAIHTSAKKHRTAILAILKDEQAAQYWAGAGVKFAEVIVQPYTPDDIHRSVHKTLGLSHKQKLPETLKMNTDRLKIELLKNLLDDGITTLHPVADPDSPIGYSWPDLAKFVDLDIAATEQLLDDLAEQAILDRRLHDKIHICPTCNRYNVNFREVCPSCGSIDIELQEMIHHFACGYVGPISQFQQGMKFICPKCRAELRHIGLDYEKPAETFLCNVNGHVFTDPGVEAYCLACGDKFEPKDLNLRNVYAYTLTGRAEDAVQSGSIEPAEIDPLLLDPHLGIYHHSYFERELDTEVGRSKRYGHRFSLLVMGLDYYDDFINKLGRSEALQYLRVLSQATREMIRISDTPARLDKDKIIVLLSETPPEGAVSLTARLRKRLDEIKLPRTDVKISFSTGISGYPEFGETAAELVESAKIAYNRAQNSGKETIAEKPAKKKK